MTTSYQLISQDDPRLRANSTDVDIAEIDQLGDLITAMGAIMDHEGAFGISAPQVGVNKRLFIIAGDPKLVVIMASTLTTRNAEISFKAMAAGAKDYVPKPSAVVAGAGAAACRRSGGVFSFMAVGSRSSWLRV